MLSIEAVRQKIRIKPYLRRLDSVLDDKMILKSINRINPLTKG